MKVRVINFRCPDRSLRFHRQAHQGHAPPSRERWSDPDARQHRQRRRTRASAFRRATRSRPRFPRHLAATAICAGEDPSIFFPAHGDPGVAARNVCANCPVQMDCLEYAIAADKWGIWGGWDRDQRRALRDSADESALPPGYAIVRDENREQA